MAKMTFRGREVVRDRALVMAIVNRTPDSFYDRGATFAEVAARDAISLAVDEGADVIDIGGVPASPGPEVTLDEELRRILPTVEWARSEFPDLVISIETYRHEVADQACRAGADLLNDVWQAYDPKMLDVAAEHGAGYVCAHTNGLKPRTNPIRPAFEDVVGTVIAETTRLAERAAARGVPREGILIDPAVTFGKHAGHALTLLGNVRQLVETGWPVLIAVSNQTFIGQALGLDVEDRLPATLAATAIAAEAGATMFRAHQVAETCQALDMIAGITGDRAPRRTLD